MASRYCAEDAALREPSVFATKPCLLEAKTWQLLDSRVWRGSNFGAHKGVEVQVLFQY
jgi:hypothetical protein